MTEALRAGPAGVAPVLIRFGRVGDMVLQAPLLHLLHRRFRRPCILLSAGDAAPALYRGNDDVAEIWALRTRHAPFWLSPEQWQWVRRLARHAGPIYVSEEVPRQLEKIRRWLAMAKVPAGRCLFLTEQPVMAPHWVDRLLDFGRLTPDAFAAADYPWAENDLRRAPHLPLLPSDRADRERWLRARGFDGRPLVLLQAGNRITDRGKPAGYRGDSKFWPASHWSALLRAMRQRLPASQLLLCGSPPETPLLKEIQLEAGLDRVAVISDDLPLRRLLALAEIAHSMVTVDTGPAHLAAAAGCPLVVLYGAESPALWDRRNPLGKPVINLGGLPERQRIDQIGLDEVVMAWSTLVP